MTFVMKFHVIGSFYIFKYSIIKVSGTISLDTSLSVPAIGTFLFSTPCFYPFDDVLTTTL